jgi:hypothetical protein
MCSILRRGIFGSSDLAASNRSDTSMLCRSKGRRWSSDRFQDWRPSERRLTRQ